MRFVCWIPRDTNTHLEHAILIGFSPQRLDEGASTLWRSISHSTYETCRIVVATVERVHNASKADESRTRRDEQRRKYSKMDKRAKDKLVRSPRENGGGCGNQHYSRELLMMGIEVPETCWAYHKYNKTGVASSSYNWINQLSNTTIWWLDICCLLHRYQLHVSALMTIFRLIDWQQNL